MGVLMSRVMAAFGDKEARILVLGLDNAGKTTILYRLQVGAVVSTIPTIGFNVETMTFKNVKFQVWDLGGQTSIRPYWRCYYPNTTAIVYVVDSCDKERIPTSKEELQGILEEDELRNAAGCCAPAAHRDAHVRVLQGEHIVDAVAGHRHHVAT